MRNYPQAVAICRPNPQALRIKQAGLMAIALIAWWLVLAVGQAMGQGGYKTLPLNAQFVSPPGAPTPEDRREESARRQRFSERNRLINNIFKGEASFEDNRAAFDEWFNEVIFAQMAQTGDEFLETMAENREEFFKQFPRANNQQAVTHVVTDLAFPKFQEIATDNYHPACRLNAVVVLGRLDDQIGSPPRVAPQPMKAALPILLQYLQDGAMPEYIRVGSMWGIERHCRIDGQKQSPQIDAALRGQLVSAMLGLLGPKPDDREASVDYWMKRMAIRSLGGLRELGNNNEVAAALIGVMEQNDAPMLLRCEAARAYGGLKFADAANAQATKVAGVIAKLAAISAQGEIDYLDDQEQEVKHVKDYKSGKLGGMGAGSGSYFGPTGMGAGGSQGAAGVGGSGSDPANPMGSGGGFDPSNPMGSGGGFPSGSGGFGRQNVAISELPVYRFRLSQRRLLTHLYFLQQALDSGVAVSPGLMKFSSDAAELSSVKTALQKLMDEAQVGLADKDELLLDQALKDFRKGIQSSITTFSELSGAEADGADPFEDAAVDAGSDDSGAADPMDMGN